MAALFKGLKHKYGAKTVSVFTNAQDDTQVHKAIFTNTHNSLCPLGDKVFVDHFLSQDVGVCLAIRRISCLSDSKEINISFTSLAVS